MSDKVNIQRNHKDTIFHDLFSDKENALSLYNALNNTTYQDTESLEVVTLSDAIYIHRKNDVSILFQDQLELWEHQSTENGNMPLRGLLYFAREIEGVLAAQGVELYGRRIVKIPTPDHYVFYNGLSAVPERQELHLSDAFMVPREGYEWTAHVLNINQGYNEELLDKCPALKGYAALVWYIRGCQREGWDLPDAVDRAIDRCIREGRLKRYLLRKKGEVKRMLLTEFNEEWFVRIMKEEGREEGRLAQRAEDILDLLSGIGAVSVELSERIRSERDDGNLRRWLRAAAKADSVEQFEQMTGWM